MKKQLCGLGVASLLLLASCGQPQNTLSENSDKTASGQTEQKIADASKADWSKAKFENEDADLYLPSENVISLPENIEENTLFIKPAFQNVKNDQKIAHFDFSMNALLANAPLNANVHVSPGFEGEFGIAINSSKKSIPTTIETTIENSRYNHNSFFGELLLDTKNGKFQKMWKFFAPKNREMTINYTLHNLIQPNSVPEKITMDISDVAPYLSNGESELYFPVYTLPRDMSINRGIFPAELYAKAYSGETILLKRGNKEERNENFTTDCLPLDRIEGAYYPFCELKASNAWLQNIASIEAIYDKRELQKIRSSNAIVDNLSLAPTFYGDEKTREGRKGIAYNPKLPFTLPEKPEDDSALLVLDAKILSGSKNIVEHVEGGFDAIRGFAFAAISPAYKGPDGENENLSKLSSSLVQQDSFFFHPNAQEDFLETSMYFLGEKAIKGKVLRLAPGAQEPRYETFFIAKEGDFYHMQTETPITTAMYPYISQQISTNISVPKKFVFDLSRIKDLWNTTENPEIFTAMSFNIVTKPTEKIKTVKVIFHNGEIREVPLRDRDYSWDVFEKEGFMLSQSRYQEEDSKYELRVSNKHTKNISKVEVMFE